MKDGDFKEVIQEIKESKVYENPANWEKRGLNPSDAKIITFLTKTTNKFLVELEKIQQSEETNDVKLMSINVLVDDLPWDELDTEEKEFMTDVLAPAIKSIGFDPWDIF